MASIIPLLSIVTIVQACLFTIFACTWTVQHLNVPEQREGRDPGLVGDIKWASKRAWTNTKWMAVTILAPELLLGKIWNDLDWAKDDLEKFKRFAEEDNVPWTLIHCLFANMGGFVTRCHVPTAVDLDSLPVESVEVTKIKRTAANPYHLIGSEIFALRESGILARLPHITKDEIKDKSKSDGFVKSITILQIGRLVVQVIARGIRGLEISQLEIATVTFAVCAIIIYGMNWSKPKGVAVPFTILQVKGPLPESVVELLHKRADKRSFVDLFTLNTERNIKNGLRVANDYIPSTGWADIFGIFLGSVVFGAIHIAAWKFEFPSKIESILCRASSSFCTGFFFIIDSGIDEAHGRNLFLFASMFAYILARLYLTIEIFRTLCFLPASAYVSTWAANIPHVF